MGVNCSNSSQVYDTDSLCLVFGFTLLLGWAPSSGNVDSKSNQSSCSCYLQSDLIWFEAFTAVAANAVATAAFECKGMQLDAFGCYKMQLDAIECNWMQLGAVLGWWMVFV